MSKMQNLSIVEEEIFAFLKSSFHMRVQDVKPALTKLLEKLKMHENNRFETRAFLYLDIISWLESKIEAVPVQQIIQRKFQQRKIRY